ncbi:hypothetical protein F8566_45610 [Actinomadura rudentiformis]|uniref:YqeB PH domain-containing protein n=1 Tax=Actinomadura rudentiformis TaxID=359158 RepID=A0A6H9Y820_9ACTN|nr:hypothetical protein [Actinomadura rudentiformis]KAB2340148.1 hypothetical protein F8566_45610 [Actinomadura rudentiformis]
MLPSPWPTVLAAVVGALAGFLLGTIASHESLSVTVSAEYVVLTGKGEQRKFACNEIGRAFMEDKQLILLDRNGQNLTRQDCGLKPRRLSSAFLRHGCPWSEGSPDRTA